MRVLIVGDLGGHLATATKIALERRAKVAHVADVTSATSALRAGRGADLLLVDIGLDIAALIAANDAERIVAPVVACGVEATPEEAAAAIRAGAKEFIPLPPDPELIASVLEAVSRTNHDLIARDPAMTETLALADQVAASDAPILITGESGVGKEVIARYVHARSRRANKAFIAVNCAAIPENLLESELFGHEKGAFTGALARRIGKFEEAHGGTLLLDEISEMDARLQAKLLRAIQEREIDRVGGSAPVKVDIRILATSNRDLTEAVRQGAFRQDLLFRLNVVNLALPPLRSRPRDIEALAAHFADKYAAANGLPRRPLAAPALAELQARAWPGNVRELENTMHRAVLLAQGPEIGLDALRAPEGAALAPAASPPAAGPGVFAADETARAAVRAAESALVGKTVAEVEQTLILDTLDHCLGNRTHAATILGISIRTLRNKLRAYIDAGVDVPAPGARRVG